MSRVAASILRVERAWPAWADALVVGAAGALHALAFAPNDAPWLQTLAVALLAWRVAAGASTRRAALLGLLFSTAWLVGGVWWLFISMHRYGGMPAWMAATAVLALCAFLSLYLAAAMAAWVRLRRGGLPLAVDALAFASTWLLAELARALIFTGFPWVAAGYAHVDGPQAALAPWIGVYGIGAVSACAGALIGIAIGAMRSRRVVVAVAAALLLWWSPALVARLVPGAFEFSRPNGRLAVALVQTNVPQEEKFASAHQPDAIAWMLRAMVEAKADLVVLPETAIPLLPEQLPPEFWGSLVARFADGPRAALVGLPLGNLAKGYTNSVAGLSAESARQPDGFYRYDKHHLVPFGEFIPFGFRWFVDLMHMPLGDFARGPLAAKSFAVGAQPNLQRVAPNICYEDLFGEELAARFVDEAGAPTILANLSNIAWFGDSVAIDQHLQIARLRSLELQRPTIRATNTGATVAIDHRGEVTHQIAPHTRGVLEASVEGRVGTTPYAWWAGRFGLWPLVAWAVVMLAMAARMRRR